MYEDRILCSFPQNALFASTYYDNHYVRSTAHTAFHHCTFQVMTAHFVHHCTLKQAVHCWCFVGIAVLELKRKPVNGLNLEFLTELNTPLEKLENDKQINGLIITSVSLKL